MKEKGVAVLFRLVHEPFAGHQVAVRPAVERLPRARDGVCRPVHACAVKRNVVVKDGENGLLPLRRGQVGSIQRDAVAEVEEHVPLPFKHKFFAGLAFLHAVSPYGGFGPERLPLPLPVMSPVVSCAASRPALSKAERSVRRIYRLSPLRTSETDAPAGRSFSAAITSGLSQIPAPSRAETLMAKARDSRSSYPASDRARAARAPSA